MDDFDILFHLHLDTEERNLSVGRVIEHQTGYLSSTLPLH